MNRKRKNHSQVGICHPSEVDSFCRRQLLQKGVSFLGFMGVASLFRSSSALAQSSYPPKKRLVWISMGGGWDILEITDPKKSSTSDIDMSYAWSLAHQIGDNSNNRIGRWLPNLAARSDDLVVVRGLSMGTNSHDAGKVYMDTGVLSNSGRVNAASIPAIIASESQATIPIVQLSGGAEPLTDRGLFRPLTVVRAQNLELYRSMYPSTPDDKEQKMLMLDYLKNSIARAKANQGENDRLTGIEAAEDKIRGQFEDNVGRRMGISDADIAPFSRNAPASLNTNIRDAFALTAKLLKNNLVTSINLGIDGFDTHASQEQRMRPLVENFDHLISALIDELKDANALDNTLIVVYSDFGRTPKVNGSAGRDHWPVGGALMIGGGIDGGRIVGDTNNSLQAEWTNPANGAISDSSTGVQLNPTHLGGSVLDLVLGSDYLQYRSYLESIPALVRLKG
jgi:hypothetical protein